MLAAVTASVSTRLLPGEAELLPGTDSGCLFALHRRISSYCLLASFDPDPLDHWVKDESESVSSSARDLQDRGAVHGLRRRRNTARAGGARSRRRCRHEALRHTERCVRLCVEMEHGNESGT